MPKISCVIVARNEEAFLDKTLKSVETQTVKPSILLVDDGSLNGTLDIARRYCEKIVELPYHDGRLVGTPKLAWNWNQGLKYIRDHWKQDYVLTLGADHILPRDYIEKTVDRMSDGIVLASGSIRGEKTSSPRGSSRITQHDFWLKASKLQYPVNYGWESYTVFKALYTGRKVKCYPDIITDVQRPTSSYASMELGMGMYALGYNWKYAIARSLIVSLRNKDISGLKMLYGWLTHRGIERMDIAEGVNEMQTKMLIEKVKRLLKRDTYLKVIIKS